METAALRTISEWVCKKWSRFSSYFLKSVIKKNTTKPIKIKNNKQGYNARQQHITASTTLGVPIS
jgi:hypothetical protein